MTLPIELPISVQIQRAKNDLYDGEYVGEEDRNGDESGIELTSRQWILAGYGGTIRLI